jgi:hypothetical protein
MSTLSINHIFAKQAIDFLPNYFVNGLDTEQEVSWSQDVGEYIDSALDDYLSPSSCIYYPNSTVYGMDLYLYLFAYYSIDDIIVYSKGHRGLPFYPELDHISLLDHYGEGYWDCTIYTRTSSAYKVTFIWHCQSEMYYPGDDTIPQDEHGPLSMPYCWTHNQYMDEYGTSGSQVFLGWNDNVPDPPYPEQDGGSPQYEYEIVPDTWNYLHVAYFFWYYMCSGTTVDQALDNLAYILFGENDFVDTPLQGWLVVWGNINLYLP